MREIPKKTIKSKFFDLLNRAVKPSPKVDKKVGQKKSGDYSEKQTR